MIQEWEARGAGEITLSAKCVETGKTVTWNPTFKSPSASVIKLPILIHAALLAQKGGLNWEQMLTLKEKDKTPGSGVLTHLSEGLKLSTKDVCTLMICMSDNSATNMMIDILGVEPINERIRDLGCTDTELFRKVFSKDPHKDPEDAKYGLGVTTPADQLHLLEMIQSNKIGDTETCDTIRTMLGKQFYREGIPRLLGPDTTFMGKSGSVDHVRNDVGIVVTPEGRTIIMAIFCQGIVEVLWTSNNVGLLAISNLSKAIVEYLSE